MHRSLASAALLAALAVPAVAQVSQDVQTSLNVQVEPSLSFVVNGSNTGSYDGSQQGVFRVGDATGCLYTTLNSITITRQGLNTGSPGGSFTLSAPGVSRELNYSPRMELREDSGNFKSLATGLNSGNGAVFTEEMIGFDVDDSTCSAGDNVNLHAFVSATNSVSGLPTYASIEEMVQAEGFDDGVLRTFTDIVTITIEPGL